MMNWTREVVQRYSGATVTFQRISYEDKTVLNVLVDDVMDTTFDIPLEGLSELGAEPVLLVGDPLNLKIQVIAAQIGKVAATKTHKGVILTIGSRWFGSETQDGDFEKLMFVLENVKLVLEEQET